MNNFLQGKRPSPVAALVPSPIARPASLPTLAPAPQPASQRETGTQIEVVKEGDRVARLIITCACGERIEVECLYPAG